jgi:4-amino-4-deoxy-L-arabinose transferase-like glycosyltransferase
MQKVITWAKNNDLILIVIGTFLVRLPSLFFYTRSDFPEFYRDYFMAGKIAGGSLVLAGPGSILGGYHFGALYYYLLLPGYFLLNHHPASLLLTSIMFSCLSVWGVYRLVFEWTKDVNTARLVSVLCTLSVYSVFLTSFVSNPNLLPAFVVWSLYHLTIILDNRARLSNFILLGLLVGFASQLHTTALVVLIPLVMLTLIFTRANIGFKNIIVLVLSFLVSNILYFYFEISVRLQNFYSLLHLASENLHGSQVLNNLNVITNFFVGSLSPFSRYYPFTNLQFGWPFALAR